GGEKVTIVVTATDAFGVEKAIDARLLTAPQLAVGAASSCADAVLERLSTSPPSGWSPAGTRARVALCKNTVVTARASLVAGDRLFAPAKVGPVNYQWSDLRVTTAGDDGRWTTVPSTWKTAYPRA